MTKPIIKEAQEKDIDEIYSMIWELAKYEKEVDDSLDLNTVKVTKDKIYDSFFKSKVAHAFLIYEINEENKLKEKIAGMAIYFYNFSTWTGSPGIYLEDLFVRKEYRGKGYGIALLSRLAKLADDNNYPRLDWVVLKDNIPSLKFYESDTIGAIRQDNWHLMRVNSQNIKKLANKVDWL